MTAVIIILMLIGMMLKDFQAVIIGLGVLILYDISQEVKKANKRLAQLTKSSDEAIHLFKTSDYCSHERK